MFGMHGNALLWVSFEMEVPHPLIVVVHSYRLMCINSNRIVLLRIILLPNPSKSYFGHWGRPGGAAPQVFLTGNCAMSHLSSRAPFAKMRGEFGKLGKVGKEYDSDQHSDGSGWPPLIIDFILKQMFGWDVSLGPWLAVWMTRVA